MLREETAAGLVGSGDQLPPPQMDPSLCRTCFADLTHMSTVHTCSCKQSQSSHHLGPV
jgi:hypothetical protein